jgi:hypothetical protein
MEQVTMTREELARLFKAMKAQIKQELWTELVGAMDERDRKLIHRRMNIDDSRKVQEQLKEVLIRAVNDSHIGFLFPNLTDSDTTTDCNEHRSQKSEEGRSVCSDQ